MALDDHPLGALQVEFKVVGQATEAGRRRAVGVNRVAAAVQERLYTGDHNQRCMDPRRWPGRLLPAYECPLGGIYKWHGHGWANGVSNSSSIGGGGASRAADRG